MVLVCLMYTHACKCVNHCMVLQVFPQAFLKKKNFKTFSAPYYYKPQAQLLSLGAVMLG